MNKTAIKNFAIWARNKLMAEIKYKAGLLGITEKEIKSPLPQSSAAVQFFDIGTQEPYSITGAEIGQRQKLAEEIRRKAESADYPTAFRSMVEEVAYTWFNRLIAIRFMEVNDYLPTRIRVLSSESAAKNEPDLVTHPLDADLGYTPYEKDRIAQLKLDNKLDELFRLLFIKQCNALNELLPALFEKTNDYTELLLNVSFTDQDGVMRHLVSDIPEDDFNVAKEGQVEIIGWLYQYYNTEPKDETFALLKKNVKITKERIPAATQLFTPDWIVRYMVENSLGRLWLEGHPNDSLKSGWKYYLDEAKQEAQVQAQLEKIREEYQQIKPEEIKIIDPCMGSGHILVYAFDVLLRIYESCGYSQRDAARSIVENNLYGLDIDKRAYQLAYFAVLMKARQYHRRILGEGVRYNLYAIEESNGINREQLHYFGQSMDPLSRNVALTQMQALLDTMKDAKEYGSIIKMEPLDWPLLRDFVTDTNFQGQMTLDAVGLDETQERLQQLVEIAAALAQKYDVVVTNPPYMGSSGMGAKLAEYVKKEYPDCKADLFAVFIERCERMAARNRYQAMVTMQAWMFLSSFEEMRKTIVNNADISSLAQIGYNSFPEINSKVAQAVAFVFRKANTKSYAGKYLDLTNKYPQSYDKEKAFFRESQSGFHCVKQENFSRIPGMPIAYWVSEGLICAFDNKKLICYANPRQGLATGDNNRFTRLWFEINRGKIYFTAISGTDAQKSKAKWFPYNKGGEFRKWYGNNDYVVNWETDGWEIRNLLDEHGKLRSRPQNIDWFFKPSITWSKISSGSIAFRYKPAGHIFDVAGTSIFVIDEIRAYLQGFCNSVVALKIANILSPTLNYEVGHVANFPIIINKGKKQNIDTVVSSNILISQSDWDFFETSWDFKKHPLLRDIRTLSDAFTQWQQFTDSQFAQLKTNEEELNRIFIDIYGLQVELTPEVEDKDVTIRRADLGRDIRSLVSYAVGCMFGRASLDVEGLAYAGGEWVGSKYSTFIPDKDNILPITDEEYFQDDLVNRFVQFVKQVYGPETLEENLDFIANALGNQGNNSREVIRQYFLRDFFKNHCQIYQKRPIYWLFDSGKADGFKALIYLHRYNADTIGNLRIDYLHRLQRIYESEIVRMQDMIDNSKDAREVATARKRKEKLVKQLQETKVYDEKIAHLALARIDLDLDDGVVVNYEKLQTGTDGRKLEVLAKI